MAVPIVSIFGSGEYEMHGAGHALLSAEQVHPGERLRAAEIFPS